MATEQPAQASLLGLPAELRNQILELALIEWEIYPVNANGHIWMRKRWHLPSDRNNKENREWHQPPITRTNRQLRSETLSMMYEKGYFAVTVNSMLLFPLKAWAERIGVENCRRLKHVEVYFERPDQFARGRSSDLMAAEAFRNSELGQALTPALRYDTLFEHDPITGGVDYADTSTMGLKPPHSFYRLVRMATLQHMDRVATIPEIDTWITARYSHYVMQSNHQLRAKIWSVLSPGSTFMRDVGSPFQADVHRWKWWMTEAELSDAEYLYCTLRQIWTKK